MTRVTEAAADRDRRPPPLTNAELLAEVERGSRLAAELEKMVGRWSPERNCGPAILLGPLSWCGPGCVCFPERPWCRNYEEVE